MAVRKTLSAADGTSLVEGRCIFMQAGRGARWREPGIAGPRANAVACCFPRACPLLSRLLFVGAWGPVVCEWNIL